MSLTKLARFLSFAGRACIGLALAILVGVAASGSKNIPDPVSIGFAGAGSSLLVGAFAVRIVAAWRSPSGPYDQPKSSN